MSTAASIVRTGRLNAGLSQSELARRARVPQSSISRIEAGGRDPGIALLDRLLAPGNHHLSLLPTRTPSVAESADTIRQLIADGREAYVFRALIQIANDLADAEPALRVALSVTPPTPTGHPGVDAFLAAAVEYRLAGEGLPCPTWVHDQFRTVKPEWSASGLSTLIEITREGTPESFRSRGVLIHTDDLVSY